MGGIEFWQTAPNATQAKKAPVNAGSASGASDSHCSTSTASAANGRPYRNRTSVAASVPIWPTSARWAALRMVCANAAQMTIGIQAQAAAAGSCKSAAPWIDADQ